MLDILIDHLKTSASPELEAAITEACELFEHFNLPGYQDKYTELLMVCDNNELSDVVSAVSTLTIDIQKDLLLMFEITVNDHSSISRNNKILTMLKDVEYSELKLEIQSICSEEVDPIEAFAALMELITAQPSEIYHECVESVSSSLIDKIGKVTKDSTNEESYKEQINVEKDKQLVATLLSFMDKASVTSLIVYSLIEQGMTLGLAFKEYYDKIIQVVAPIYPKQTAIELYAATLVCAEEGMNPRSLIMRELSNTYSSIDTITPIIVAVDSLSLAFHIDKTSGISKVE